MGGRRRGEEGGRHSGSSTSGVGRVQTSARGGERAREREQGNMVSPKEISFSSAVAAMLRKRPSS